MTVGVHDRGEFMAQVRQIIDETVEQSAELIRAETMLALKEYQIESEDRMRTMMKEVMEEEVKKFFGETKPHEHTQHHSQLEGLLDLKADLTKAFWRRVAAVFFIIIAIGFVFVGTGGLSQLNVTPTQLQPRIDSQHSSEPKE